MTIKVSDVMRHVRNHFIRSAVSGEFAHVSGVLTPTASFSPGMWVAITGEGAPCGVFQLDELGGIPDQADAVWNGTVYLLEPPADFLRLCGDIGCWAAANPDPAVTGERLGEYSVSRRAVTWENAFASALTPYRRMFPEVSL